jgi:hypothetical protein
MVVVTSAGSETAEATGPAHETKNAPPEVFTPAVFCRYAFGALDASEGRRRRRKRNTTPDEIGMQLKRDLLQRVVEEDPSPEDFEGWLLKQALTAVAGGPVRAICTEIWYEYQVAAADPGFGRWLARGAPSADSQLEEQAGDTSLSCTLEEPIGEGPRQRR